MIPEINEQMIEMDLDMEHKMQELEETKEREDDDINVSTDTVVNANGDQRRELEQGKQGQRCNERWAKTIFVVGSIWRIKNPTRKQMEVALRIHCFIMEKEMVELKQGELQMAEHKTAISKRERFHQQ